MHMTILFVLLAVVLAGAAIAKTILANKGKKQGPAGYELRTPLFSAAERSFLGVLDLAVGTQFRVMGKVNLADVVHPVKGLNASARRSALNKISQKHVDFLLCDPATLEPRCVIELNDSSHKQDHRKERDAFLKQVCIDVRLPLVFVPAQKAYKVEELRQQLGAAFAEYAPRRTQSQIQRTTT